MKKQKLLPKDATGHDGERDLVLALTFEAPREKVWRCWTEPELLMQWFTPRLWTTARAELDVRPGGACLVVMRSPSFNSNSQLAFVTKCARKDQRLTRPVVSWDIMSTILKGNR